MQFLIVCLNTGMKPSNVMYWLASTALLLANADATLRSSNAASYQDNFYGLWEQLFLDEDRDALYPFPRSTQIVDLLDAFQGIGGVAVHTKPAVTVSEGQGYAMFAAGMRGDVPTLKKLAVGWQGMGQGFGGQAPCGGCTLDDESWPTPEDVCAQTTASANGIICKLGTSFGQEKRKPTAGFPGFHHIAPRGT